MAMFQDRINLYVGNDVLYVVSNWAKKWTSMVKRVRSSFSDLVICLID